MDLTQVSVGVQKRRLKKRVGRGIGSGHGKTGSRGMKGQYSSAGAQMPGTLFTGGQTPIHRRFPKRGFTNGMFRKTYAEVNVGQLEGLDNRAAVTLDSLRAAGIVKGGMYDGLRVLGDGELTKTVYVKAEHVTAAARKKIEFTGGTVEVIPPPKKPVKNKMGSGKWSKRNADGSRKNVKPAGDAPAAPAAGDAPKPAQG